MTITETNKIDVISKYNELVRESLDGDSVYIRVKETLQEMLTAGEITEGEKGQALASILGSISNGVVSSSMSTALQWGAKEKELAFQKLELEMQLELLEQSIKGKTAEVGKITSEDLAIQASNLRTNGQSIVVNGKVASLRDDGKVYIDMEYTKQQTDTSAAEEGLIDSKKLEINAGVHKTIADTYVNYGSFSGYSITDSGVTGVNMHKPTDLATLSEIQASIAKEQAKGFAYNAWASAASGLGATIGTALSSEVDIFDGAKDVAILTNWSAAVSKLQNVSAPTFTY